MGESEHASTLGYAMDTKHVMCGVINNGRKCDQQDRVGISSKMRNESVEEKEKSLSNSWERVKVNYITCNNENSRKLGKPD